MLIHTLRTSTLDRRAFTLVEMLIVTLLIVIVLALLMPMAAAAKRQANAVKCLAHLRQIGAAFQMYEAEHRGVWPVAVHTSASRNESDRYWMDQLQPYIQRTDVAVSRDKSDQSLFRGCPEWINERERFHGDRTRVGYGMQYYPSFFTDQDRFKLAYILPITTRAGTTYVGQYSRNSRWRHSAAQRGLIADSITPMMTMPNGRISKRTLSFYPYDWDGSSRPPGFFYIDSTRHASPSISRDQILNTRSVNMLFCDGHADRVTVLEAYNAIRNPGEDVFRHAFHTNANPY